MDAKYWLSELDREERGFKKWRKAFGDLVKRYRDDERTEDNKFNIFWANTETLKPVAYGRTPEPIVRRRYLDQDPVGMMASELVQRGLAWNVDDNDFHGEMERVRDDLLIGGRGVARIKYHAEFGRYTPAPLMLEGMEEPYAYEFAGEVVEPEFGDEGPYVERKEREFVYTCYVHWKDFKCDPARSWDEVKWVAFRHMMTKGDLKKAFGKKAAKVEVSHHADQDKGGEDAGKPRYACVWEIWHKPGKKRIWVAEGHDRILDEEPDPLQLEGFFPCPEPACLIQTTDTLVPVPEFMVYQDQADELNDVCQRISKLVKAAQAKGLYAGDLKEMVDLINDLEDGQLKAVADPEMYGQRGGLRGNIWFMPIQEIVASIVALTQREQHLKQQIYEISGISDIMRGSTRASETAAAQQLKGQFAAVRTGPRSEPMRRMVRDLYRMMAEVMCRFFSPEEWQRITGKQVDPQVLELMRDPALFEFRVDIETDATVAEDAAAKKQEAVEFVTAFTQFLQAASQIVQGAPETAPMMGEIAKWTLRRFGSARDLEQIISGTMDQLSQKAQQPPPPDPKVEAMKAKAQIDQQKAQADIQLKQLDGQIKAQQAEQDMMFDQKRFEQEMAQAQAEANQDRAITAQKANLDLKVTGAKASMAPSGPNGAKPRPVKVEVPQVEPPPEMPSAVERAAEAQIQAAMTQSQAAMALTQAVQGLAEAARMMAAPKRIIRGEDGRAESVAPILN